MIKRIQPQLLTQTPEHIKIISLTKKKSNPLIKIQSNAVSTIQTPKSQSLFFLSLFEGNMFSYNQKVHSQKCSFHNPNTQIPKSFYFSRNMLSYNQKVHSQSNIQNHLTPPLFFLPFGKIKMWPCDEKNHASSFNWCKPTYQNQSKSNILKETTAFF